MNVDIYNKLEKYKIAFFKENPQEYSFKKTKFIDFHLCPATNYTFCTYIIKSLKLGKRITRLPIF